MDLSLFQSQSNLNRNLPSSPRHPQMSSSIRFGSVVTEHELLSRTIPNLFTSVRSPQIASTPSPAPAWERAPVPQPRRGAPNLKLGSVTVSAHTHVERKKERKKQQKSKKKKRFFLTFFLSRLVDTHQGAAQRVEQRQHAHHVARLAHAAHAAARSRLLWLA
jgi:hypothetical protein